MDPSSKLLEIFDRSFPRDFQAETLKLLNLVYKESKFLAADYGPFRSKVIRPQIRVETFNTRWSVLARKFGLQGGSYPNCTGTYPVELIEGTEMMLTAKLVDRPLQVPQDALYIKQLASKKNPSERQRVLPLYEPLTGAKAEVEKIASIKDFKDSKASLQSKNKYYGILVHGYSKSAELDFAQVLMPDADCVSWLAVADLLVRHSAVLAAPREEIIEINQPTIRRKAEEEGGDK